LTDFALAAEPVLCSPAGRDERAVDEYDVRLPLQSLPQTQVVDITAAPHEMQGGAVRVTLVAVESGEDGGPRVSDAFAAEEIPLVTIAGAGDTGPAQAT